MKKVLFAVFALSMLTFCSCNGLNIRYSSTKAQGEVSRELKGFERIEQLGSLDVIYHQADSFSVRVSAPVDVIGDVETRVEGNKLIVKMKGEGNVINFGVPDSENVMVYVTSPDFIGIALKGSGDFVCQHKLDTDKLDIVLNGSGDIRFDDIICDQVHVSLVGSGDVTLQNVKMLQSYVNLVGSGDVNMHFDNGGTVESNLTGSGDITLSGIVKDSRYNVRGSGDMNTEQLTVRK